jgi:hypothetical protein
VPRLAQSDADLPGSVDKGIPGVTAVINDIVARFDDSVREPVDVRDNGGIGGSHLSRRQMQSGLIDDRDSMGSQCGALGRVPRLAYLRVMMFFQFTRFIR